MPCSWKASQGIQSGTKNAATHVDPLLWRNWNARERAFSIANRCSRLTVVRNPPQRVEMNSFMVWLINLAAITCLLLQGSFEQVHAQAAVNFP
jgi:hypothetical protein